MLHVDLIAPIATLLERHAQQRPGQIAYWDSLRSVTYAALARRTASIAANLTKAGLRDRDRIAIYLPNGVDWIEACFAALRAGAVVVPISYDAAEGEISYRLIDAGCGFVVTTPARKDTIHKVCRDSSIAPDVIFAGADAETEAFRWLALRLTMPQRPPIPMTSIVRRSSSTRRGRPGGQRACCCRYAACFGSLRRAGHRLRN